jgi:predicted nuclease of predicted toxin-antitoxin system
MTTIWVDAHLSAAIATWITDNFEVTAVALRDLGLRVPKILRFSQRQKPKK